MYHKKQQLRKRCDCHDLGTHWDFDYHSDWCEYVSWSQKRLEEHKQKYEAWKSAHLTPFSADVLEACAECEYKPCDGIPQNHADYCPARR